MLIGFSALGASPHADTIDRLIGRAVEGAEAESTSSLTRLLCAMHKLRPDAVSSHVCAPMRHIYSQRIAQMTPQESVGVLHALALAGAWPSNDIFEDLRARILSCVPELEPKLVVVTQWALSKMRQLPYDELRAALTQRALESAHLFTALDVSNMLWAYAKLDTEPPSEALMQSLCKRTLELARAHAFSASLASNITWSLARLRQVNEADLLAALEQTTAKNVQELRPLTLCNFLWGYAVLKTNLTDTTLRAICTHITAIISLFDAQAVSRTMWSLASLVKLPRTDTAQTDTLQTDTLQTDTAQTDTARTEAALNITRDAVDSLCVRAREICDTLHTQHVTNILWALSEFGGKPKHELLQALQERASKTVHEASGQEIVGILWSFARMGVEADPKLIASFRRQALARMGEFSQDDIKGVRLALEALGVGRDAATGVGRDAATDGDVRDDGRHEH
jgi:hypothetical protein